MVALNLASATPAAGSTLVGFQGPSFSPISAPTGEKPQSKLWFAGATWWGLLYRTTTGDHAIHRLDWASQTWVDTGVPVDTRDHVNADVLWDGSRVYIATAMRPGATTDDSRALLRRFSLDPATGRHQLDAGFPLVIADAAMEAVVMDKDTTGAVWVTWTAPTIAGGRRVMVTHTNADESALVPPFVPPVTGASNLNADDISAVVAFRSHIGVMWSNQNDGAIYFATHRDGDPDGAWTVDPALQGPEYADDHLSLKSLQADASGEVFAAVKTSLNAADAPLVLVLVLNQGSWRRHTFGTVADDHTRPLVLIDRTNRELYVFAPSPCCTGGVIYMKKAPLDAISFPEGKGTPFISSSVETNINNPTSTKQPLDATTGLVVLAGDHRAQRYLHNRLELGNPVDTVIDSGPSGVVDADTASFAFSSPSVGATFECSLDAAPYAPCTSPAAYAGLADGPHAFAVRAVTSTGEVDATPATRDWTVDVLAPAVAATSPAAGETGVSPDGVVTALFSEPMDPATVTASTFRLAAPSAPPVVATVSYDATAEAAVLRPDAVLAAGTTYTATVVGGDGGVRDMAGTPLPSDTFWSFTTGEPVILFADGFETGDLSRWSRVVTGSTGSAIVQSDVVFSGSYAALLSATTAANSHAYLRSDLAQPHADLTVSARFRMQGEGDDRRDVPVAKVSGTSSTMALLLRQNGTGELRVRYGGVTHPTTGRLPLGEWTEVSLRVVTAGTGTVELRVGGVLVHQSATADLGADPADRVYVGSDHKRRPFALAVDEVRLHG